MTLRSQAIAVRGRGGLARGGRGALRRKCRAKGSCRCSRGRRRARRSRRGWCRRGGFLIFSTNGADDEGRGDQECSDEGKFVHLARRHLWPRLEQAAVDWAVADIRRAICGDLSDHEGAIVSPRPAHRSVSRCAERGGECKAPTITVSQFESVRGRRAPGGGA